MNHLWQAYNSLTAVQFAVPILFGAGRGVAQVLFGISIQRLGLTLAYALVVGLGTLLGTLITLFAQHRAQLDKKLLIEVLAGIVVMSIRNRFPHELGRFENGVRTLLRGDSLKGDIALRCSLRGCAAFWLQCLTTHSLSGRTLRLAAVRGGNSGVRAAYAIWPIGLAGVSFRMLRTVFTSYAKTELEGSFNSDCRIWHWPF